MAHIMTYEELEKVKVGTKVYEEIKTTGKIYPLTFDGVDFTDGDQWMNSKHYLLLEECDEETCWDYNWNYRVWNKMPTEEEQKTPWKDDPYV